MHGRNNLSRTEAACHVDKNEVVHLQIALRKQSWREKYQYRQRQSHERPGFSRDGPFRKQRLTWQHLGPASKKSTGYLKIIQLLVHPGNGIVDGNMVN